MNVLNLLIFIFFILSSLFAETPPVGKVEPEKCVSCHKTVTPLVVKEFNSGAMGKIMRQNRNIAKDIKEPGCIDCHGEDHTLITNSRGMVTEETCGKCHTEEYQQHIKGGHTGGERPTTWENLIESPDYFLIPPEIRQSSCEPCHSISGATERKFRDPQGIHYIDRGMIIKRNGCSNCHRRHAFNLETARTPEACMPCHSGGHSADYESYLSSAHGALYTNTSSTWDFTVSVRSFNFSSPTCITCHMVRFTDSGIQLKHNLRISGDVEFIELCTKCHETGTIERVRSDKNIYKRYLTTIILNNESIIDYLKKNKLIDKQHTEIENVLWILQNEGTIKNIPCLTDIVSSYNSAISGMSHGSPSIYFSYGVEKLNEALLCFDQWYNSRRIFRRLNLYVKLALLLGVISILLILILPRRRPRRTTIEF